MNENYTCPICNAELSEADQYCITCGSLFTDEITCSNHSEINASGVCIICGKAFCKQCADMVDDLFLCYDHEKYEIIEGHARVRGSSDVTMLDYYKDILQQANLNPIIYTRKSNPIHLGGAEYSMFRPAGDPNGNLINEYKLMLPFNQVLQSEQIISDLEDSELA